MDTAVTFIPADSYRNSPSHYRRCRKLGVVHDVQALVYGRCPGPEQRTKALESELATIREELAATWEGALQKSG